MRPSSVARAADLERMGATIRVADLADAAAVARAISGSEVVYHIAATYREAGQADAAYTRVNVDGTRHVLEGALAAGARRVVHCSTGGVHGHIEHPPANETRRSRRATSTSRPSSKRSSSPRRSAASHPLEVVIARPIGIYGPGDLRFLKMFRGIARGRFPMLGSGKVFYHLTYIDDLVRGFALCGQVPALPAARTSSPVPSTRPSKSSSA